jgi:hypothetical protein
MSKLEALRMHVRALESHHLETSEGGRFLPFADRRLNAPLPQGGLQLGALHEFVSDGLEAELSPAVTAFAATAAAMISQAREGYVLWASSRADCYPPGLVRFGLDPVRIVWIECRKDAEAVSVMEEALHSRALAAVLGEAGALSLKAGRRLDAAARQSGVAALLVRRPLFKSSKAGCSPSGAAATRWRVSAVPALTLSREGGRGAVSGMTNKSVGPPRWRLYLEYCRNGRPASWIVEALNGSDGEGSKAGHVRVVAELRDDACEAEGARARKAGRAARAS